MLTNPAFISEALAALSLRAIRRGQKPHIALSEIRRYHAFHQLPLPSRTEMSCITITLPPPSKASVQDMSCYFEARCKPEDFRQARSDRDWNNREARREARREAAHARA